MGTWKGDVDKIGGVAGFTLPEEAEAAAPRAAESRPVGREPRPTKAHARTEP